MNSFKKWQELNENLFPLGLSRVPAIGEIVRDRGLPVNAEQCERDHDEDEEEPEEKDQDDEKEEDEDDEENLKFMKKKGKKSAKKKVKKMHFEKKKVDLDDDEEGPHEEEEDEEPHAHDEKGRDMEPEEDEEEPEEELAKGKPKISDEEDDEEPEDDEKDQSKYGFMNKDKKKKCKMASKKMMKDHDEFAADLKKNYLVPRPRKVLDDTEFIRSLQSDFRPFQPVKEDFLIPPTDDRLLVANDTEPQPGEVGFAPQQRMGEIPANIAESADYEVLCKYFDSDFALELIKKRQAA